MKAISLAVAFVTLVAAAPAVADTTLPGLHGPAAVVRDKNGVPHIFAGREHDLFFLQLDNNPLNQLRPTGGIYYLGPAYQSLRAGRLSEVLAERLAAARRLTVADMQAIQADVVLFDAEVFVPYVLAAFDNATAAGADPLLAALAGDSRAAEAVTRLTA